MEAKIQESFKNTAAMFTFPQDSVGIQQGMSFQEIVRLVRQKFITRFGQNSQIKWCYQQSCPNPFNLQFIQFHLKCRKCSNVLIYRKNTNFQIIYRLIRMDRYHLHTSDQKKQRQLNDKIRSEKLLTVDKYEKTSQKLNRIRNQRSNIKSVEQFIKILPHGLLNGTKAQLVQEHFGVSYSEYKSKLNIIETEYNKTVIQLFQHFHRNGYQSSFLPVDIVQKNIGTYPMSYLLSLLK